MCLDGIITNVQCVYIAKWDVAARVVRLQKSVIKSAPDGSCFFWLRSSALGWKQHIIRYEGWEVSRVNRQSFLLLNVLKC